MEDLIVKILRVVGKFFLYYIGLGILTFLAFGKEAAHGDVEGIVIAFAIIFVVLVGACLHQIRRVIEEHNERQREEEERRTEEQPRSMGPEYDYEYRQISKREDSDGEEEED